MAVSSGSGGGGRNGSPLLHGPTDLVDQVCVTEGLPSLSCSQKLQLRAEPHFAVPGTRGGGECSSLAVQAPPASWLGSWWAEEGLV